MRTLKALFKGKIDEPLQKKKLSIVSRDRKKEHKKL